VTERHCSNLLHDNARQHVKSTIVQKLHQQAIEVLPDPPYSSDLSPTNFHCFRSLDNFLTQKRFRKQEDTEKAFQQFLSLRNFGSLYTYPTRISVRQILGPH
ncbi:Histone-lysine N-methyltransferase SETMAR, partial [Habropoda laboriosa]